MLNKEFVENIVGKALEGTSAFIVDIKVLPNGKVDIFIDKPEGIVVADCVKINRLLANELETLEINAEITVSSPGLDEPLKVTQQYVKNVGRQVRVITKTGEEKTGKLLAANINGIELETNERVKNGNKKENVNNHYQFTYSQLAKTEIVLSFK
jgi:ribosome maturation factor RimP